MARPKVPDKLTMLFRSSAVEFLFTLVITQILYFPVLATQPENVTDRLQDFEHEYRIMWWLHQSSDWNYSTNISKITASARNCASTVYSDWMREWKLWARGTNYYFLPTHQKQAIMTIAAGVVFMNEADTRMISELKSKLAEIYSSGKVYISGVNVTAEGESEVMSLVAQLRNPDILKEIWKSWRKQVGEKSRTAYLQLVQLTNKASQENGYSDVGEAWREELGIDDVITTVLTLWDEVKDFYKELHTYTRYKLRRLFGDQQFRYHTGIPAHLLGSLWGENWAAFSDVLMPYPKKTFINITSSLIAKGYTVVDILRKAEEFYTRMGFNSMEQSFWSKSVFVKPKDGRPVDCHAVSYDFALNDDFRVRMCAEVKEQSFLEAVHEMGHIHYYMAYHHLPMTMRNGANSAFHEAVGETMVYAAQSPKCLQTLQVQSFDVSEELVINTLMKQALSKFVLLPWALTVEIWRYTIFSGQLKEKDMMEKWWEFRKKFQGIEPPDFESSKLFDPGSKYHVALHIPYMRYFLSRFLEHQFLEALCNTSGENVHTCCFITCMKAGAQLKYMLSLGSSVSWQDALQVLTGERNLSSKPMMNYYKPLYEWLMDFNNSHNISRSW